MKTIKRVETEMLLCSYNGWTWPIGIVVISEITSSYVCNGNRGGTVVKVLCYKLEGRWFDPSWCHWNFSLT